jgi:2-oxoglutarate/2-oxoacid ferredoxin oxidoreductase subunit beta
MKHPGFALINIISPCVTFNNNMGSTKSYDYVREHIEATSTVDFVPEMKEITMTQEKGTLKEIKLHDGSKLSFNKLSDDWDPLDRQSAINAIINAKNKKEILTGLLYMNPDSQDLHSVIQTTDKPLNTLTEAELCPGNDALKDINAGQR